MKTTKRILSIVLICAMLLTLLPSAAFAADEVNTEPQQSFFERVGNWFRTTFDFLTPAGPEAQNIGIQPLGTVTHTGTVGTGGAPWRLYDDGTLVVSAGHVQSTSTTSSPWNARSSAITQIIFEGENTLGPSLRSLFRSLPHVTTIVGLENWDTGSVTDMQGMFQSAGSAISGSGIYLDISAWDTGNVTTMQSMFQGARMMSAVDLSGWNTGNVTHMGGMFSDAWNLTSTGDLSNWNVSNVTQMHGMFQITRNLTFIGDLSNWDTGNVTNMDRMFWGVASLASIGDFSIGDLSNWDVSSVTSMGQMFQGGHPLTSIGDLSNWDVSNVTNMGQMFLHSNHLTCIGDISNWNTSNVTWMSMMFANTGLTSLDLSGWDTSNVTGMQEMFAGMSNLVSLDLSGWDTGSLVEWGNPSQTWMLATNLMFQGTTSLRVLTLSEDFRFIDGTRASIPGVPNNATFTGRWQNVGNGTIDNPLGDYVFTSAQLMQNFNGAIHADTWVWQPHDHARPVPRIIELNRSGTDTPFDPVPVGYPDAFLISTRIQNISSAPTGGLTVTISGLNASSFEITHISRAAAIGVYYLLPSGSDMTADIPSLPVGNTSYLPSNRRFLIQPIAGLPTGTYTARVTVSVDNHPSGEFDEYFDLVFIVE